MALNRVRTILSGFPGGPGVSTMYFLDSTGVVAAVAAFWASVVTQMPNNVTAQVQNSGDVIEPTTGALSGSWTNAGVTFSRGTAVQPYPAPAGAVIRWNTNGIANGHRVRGRTFVVPLFGGAYQDDGSLAATCISALDNAAGSLVNALPLSFSVWHRPKYGPAPVGGGPRPILSPGSGHLITSSSVPDKSAVLRSRRD